MKDTISAATIQELIEDLKAKSYIEEQQADALEASAEQKRQYAKALA